jgi:hypothetical protein
MAPQAPFVVAEQINSWGSIFCCIGDIIYEDRDKHGQTGGIVVQASCLRQESTDVSGTFFTTFSFGGILVDNMEDAGRMPAPQLPPPQVV